MHASANLQENFGASILIVDDDPIAIQVVRRALSVYRDVRFALSGAEALRLAHERPPDLVLLDAEMPGDSGFEVCHRLKANEQLARVPVIFLTSHNDLRFETEAFAQGAADFISKPVTAPRLCLRVKLHLQLQAQFDALRALATTDPLTSLANRRVFDETIIRECMRARRMGSAISLLIADVDYFKQFNDTYGHIEGDACLKTVAAAVKEVAARATDLAARVGGEEFAIILPDTALEGAAKVGARLCSAVAGAGLPHKASNASPVVTVSVGVATMGRVSTAVEAAPPWSDAHLLFDAADRAMYEAKRLGRHRVVCADSSAQSVTEGRLLASGGS